MRYKNTLFLLFKATFRRSQKFSYSSNKLLNILLGAMVLLLATGFLVEEVMVYNALGSMLGDIWVLKTIFILVTALCVLFTLPIVVSNVFYTKDYPLLAPLPLKKEEIVLAKVGISYLYLVPFVLMVALPGIGVEVFRGQLSVPGGIWAVCIALFYPIFILSVIGLISWVVMKGESMLKNRGLVLFGANMFFFAGMIALALMLNSIIYPLLANLGPDFIEQVLAKWSEVSETVVNIFVPIKWAVNAIVEPLSMAGAGSLLLLILTNICTAVIFVSVVAKTYYVLGQKLALIPENVRGVKAFNFRGKLGQMLQREWWILNNEYYFLAEGLTELFIGPLLILIFGLFTIFARPMIPEFDKVLAMVQNFAYLDFVVVVVLVFLATMNTIGPTGLSREGKYFYLSKVLPVPPTTQYFVKFVFSTLFAMGAGVIAYLGVLLIGLNIAHPLLMLFAVLCMIFLIETGVLFFDLLKPMLGWTHPRQAMNSNANVALNMLWVFGIMGIFGGLGYLGVLAHVSFTMILTVLPVLALILGYVILQFMGKRAEKSYRKIEI